jgi:hypothetical protein
MPAAALPGAGALAFKAWSAALLLAGTFLFYSSTRDRLSPLGRVVFLAAIFFNNFYLAFVGNVLSEAGYLLIFGAGFYLAVKKRWLWDSTPRQTVLLGLLAGFLVLTRVIGAVFFLAAFLEMGLSRRLKETLRFGIVVVLTVAPYFVLSKLASGSYTFHGSGWALWTRNPASALRIPAANLYFYFKGLTLLTFVYVCPA